MINFDDPGDRAQHDRMCELVWSISTLHREIVVARAAHDKAILQRQIDVGRQQIDELVSDLYDIKNRDIGIIEKLTIA